jgi:hypothetical protein
MRAVSRGSVPFAMHALRGVLDWLVVWVVASAAVFGLVAIFVYADGAAFHRVRPCGFPITNIYFAAILAGGVGLVMALLFWALGARAVRWRVVRLIGVAGAGVLVTVAVLYGGLWFSMACMGAPSL